jgi:hypothetical protein
LASAWKESLKWQSSHSCCKKFDADVFKLSYLGFEHASEFVQGFKDRYARAEPCAEIAAREAAMRRLTV